VNWSRALITLSLLLAHPLTAQEDQLTITSPSGKIEVRLLENVPLNPSVSRLGYQVAYEGKLLVEPSPLGIRVYSAFPILGEDMRLIGSKRTSVDEIFATPQLDGKGRNHYNGLIAEFKEKSALGRILSIEVRVFDDGAGFRFLLPKSANIEKFFVEEEETEFRFVADGEAQFRSLNQETGATVPGVALLSAIPTSTQIDASLTLEPSGFPRVAVHGFSWPSGARRPVLRHVENGTTLIMRRPAACGPCVYHRDVGPLPELELRLPTKSPWRMLQIGSSPVNATETIG
jgi:alpha-glucosidase